MLPSGTPVEALLIVEVVGMAAPLLSATKTRPSEFVIL